jgi:hypothetical protein
MTNVQSRAQPSRTPSDPEDQGADARGQFRDPPPPNAAGLLAVVLAMTMPMPSVPEQVHEWTQ